MIKKSISASLLLLALPITSLAASEDTWKGEAELGLVATDGNSKTRNISAKTDINNERKSWRHNIHAEALYSSNEDITSSEKYLLSGTSNYKFNDSDSAFLTGTYDDDRFSGFEYQATLALGYGRRLINEGGEQTLDFEIGPGYRVSELYNGDSVDEAVLRVSGKYFLALSKSSNFQQTLIADAGEESTILKSISSIKAQTNGSLAMKVSLTIKNTSDVPEGVEETDSETAVTLVYGF